MADEMRKLFNLYDKDGDGSITLEELKQTMAELKKGLTPEQIEQMFREADTNGDGKIDFEEFSTMKH